MSAIFGPVYSRRFGKSLGIDLSPSKKQCNFDCLYCELEPAKTMGSYDEVVSVDEVINELQKALVQHKEIDFITLTANGEPTLYPHISELIDRIDSIKGNIQTLILSNGSTIDSSQIMQALLKLDTVKLSLDCATQRCLHRLDRAHHSIHIDSIMQGLLEFRAKYKNPLIIEILFVKSINDTQDEITKLNEFLLKLNPSRIDIGTIDRPPAYKVEAVSYKELYKISMQFDKILPIYIASRKNITFTPESYTTQQIVETITKRPLTPEDITILFDNESQKRLELLIQDEKIIKIEKNGLNFYKLHKNT